MHRFGDTNTRGTAMELLTTVITVVGGFAGMVALSFVLEGVKEIYKFFWKNS